MVLLPWVAHLYTALGALVALAAARAVIGGDFRTAFLWLAAAVVIDATDGWLARALHVKERLPAFDGARLDDIVDYLTYVFVPALLIVEADLLPPAWSLPVAGSILLASAYGFAQSTAKVKAGDYFFTGFPSYWNIVALYLYVWHLPPPAAAAILLVLAALVFVPVRYVYPSRTETLRRTTIGLGLVWGVLLLLAIWRLPDTGGPWLTLSAAYPLYYAVLSVSLDAASRRRA